MEIQINFPQSSASTSGGGRGASSSGLPRDLRQLMMRNGEEIMDKMPKNGQVNIVKKKLLFKSVFHPFFTCGEADKS